MPWGEIASVTPRATALRHPFDRAAYRAPSDDDALVWLGRDVMDRQIVDTEGVKLVRVNDVALTPLNDEMRVAGVDATTAGLLRRVGLEKGTNIAGATGKGSSSIGSRWTSARP